MTVGSRSRLLALLRTRGMIRPRELVEIGMPRVLLTRMVEQGVIERLGRGLYALPTRTVSAHTSLAEAVRRCPAGVVCLLSALRFHGLTTQSPFQVWLAIPSKARTPRVEYPPLRIVRCSDSTRSAGIGLHQIDGVLVPVTSVAKTIADCFKFRSKIGLDVAIEALRDAHDGRRLSIDELWRHSRLCRVANVIRPHVLSLR